MQVDSKYKDKYKVENLVRLSHLPPAWQICHRNTNTNLVRVSQFPILPLPDKSAYRTTQTMLGEKKQVTFLQFLRGGDQDVQKPFKQKLSSFYRICEIFTISLCKFSFGESPQRETLLGRFNKIDPESALRKPFVLTAILYSYFYLIYLRGSNVPQEIFCPDSCQNPLKFPPWKTFDWYLLSALDKGHRTGYQPKKINIFWSLFTSFEAFSHRFPEFPQIHAERSRTAERIESDSRGW